MTYPSGSLAGNLAAFCARLRLRHGFQIGPGELADAARALALVPLADERAVRDALRAVLSSRLEDVRVFDRAFEEFFLGYRGPSPLEIPGSSGDRSTGSKASGARDRPKDRMAASDDELDERREGHDSPASAVSVEKPEDERFAGLLRASYSPIAAEGVMPDLEAPDREWCAAAAAFVSRLHAGLSRRWRPARRGPRFDLRRTLRSSLRTGGDLVVPRWRARPRRRPRVVLLIDGSRSMSACVGPVLRAAVALAWVSTRTEVFTFSTALRRVTRDVRRAAAGERRPLRLHDAWGGGTTIGACLEDFLRRFGERLLGRDEVVVIVSDGLDLGEPERLRDAMARLHRQSAGIVWLNPLLDTPGYEPVALGMRAARPYVTTFGSLGDAAGLLRLSRAIRLRA